MTQAHKKITIITLFCLIILFLGGGIFTVARAAVILGNPVIKTAFSVDSVGKDCVNQATIDAELASSDKEVAGARVYFAIVYGELSGESWYKSATYSIGTVATLDIEKENISVAFIAALPKGQQAEENIAYNDFADTEKFETASPVSKAENFYVDLSRPSVSIKNSSGMYDPLIGSMLEAYPYSVDLTLRFADAGKMHSGIRLITIKGYRQTPIVMEITDKAINEKGEYILPAVDPNYVVNTAEEKSYRLGVRDVQITVTDYAGNTNQTLKFKIGLPDYRTQKLSYAEKMELVTEFKLQSQKYYVSKTDDAYPNLQTDIVDNINKELSAEQLLIDDFKNYAERTDFQLLSDSTVDAFISSINEWSAKYQVLIDKGDQTMLDEVAVRYGALQKYVRKFREIRFTSNGVYVNMSRFYYNTLDDLTDRLSYKAVVTIEFPTDTTLEAEKALHLKYQENSMLMAVITVKIFDGNVDKTNEFISTSGEITVNNAGNVYDVDKPTLMVTKNANGELESMEAAESKETNTLRITVEGLGFDIFIGQTMVTSQFLFYFLRIGLPILLALILVSVAIIIIFIYRKKAGTPDEKLEKLKLEVEKKKSVSDIIKKSKEEEEEINRKYQEESEKERIAAIEKVKAARRQQLSEKERALREQADDEEAERKAAELKAYELMAIQKVKKLVTKEEKKAVKKTAEKATKKTTTKRGSKKK